jgi:hypothetical protein
MENSVRTQMSSHFDHGAVTTIVELFTGYMCYCLLRNNVTNVGVPYHLITCFLTENKTVIFIAPIRATCCAHPILLELLL